MIRNEIEIAYASLAKFIKDFELLPDDITFKFDYDPIEIQELKSFPAVGIRKVSDLTTKRFDRHAEYCETERDGKFYSWYEIGVYNLSCTVALFMDSEDTNPIPFLRNWYSDIMRRAIKFMRIPAEDPDLPNEFITIKINGSPFEQHGSRLTSIKFTVDISGKMLDCVEAKIQTNNGWINIRA